MELLESGTNIKPSERHINQTAGLIEKTLDEFGIPAKVIGFQVGPTITQFALEPGFVDKHTSGEQTEEQTSESARGPNFSPAQRSGTGAFSGAVAYSGAGPGTAVRGDRGAE